MISCSFFIIIVLLKCCKAQEVTVEAVLGHNAELPCNVSSEKEDDKLNILAWYRQGSTTAFYSHDLREGAGNVMSPGGRYALVESKSEGLDKLQIIGVIGSDAGIYHCVADFVASPALKTYIQLVVIEPPQRLWVIHENGTRVATASVGSNTSQNIGPYFVGDTIHLFCVAFGGKPLASLSWLADQQLLKDTCTPLSEQRVRSDFTYGPLRREDHGQILTCYAKNNEKTPPLSIDVIIDMYLPPQLVSVRVAGSKADSVSGGRVKAGEPLSLECRVLGAKPLPSIIWRMDDSQLFNLEQNITMEPSQRLLVSDVQLSISPEYDEAHITCCAPAHERDAEKFVCAVSLPLTVLYPPVLRIVIEEEFDNKTLSVLKGSDVSLNCSYQANPSVYQLIWFHEEEMLTTNTEPGKPAIQASVTLTEVAEKDAGEYVCAATNDEGFTYSEPVVIDVIYPAYCERENVMEYGIADNECVNLTCKVKGNPEPTIYHWMLITEVNGSRMRSNQSITLETEDATLMYQRPNGTTALIYCWGINGVISNELQQKKCTFLVSDETPPRSPTNCVAVRNVLAEITVTCDEGSDGGLQQKFKFTVSSINSEKEFLTIINQEPKFMIPELKLENYKIVIVAFNDKGESARVEIDQDNIVDENVGTEATISAVTNITTLALALCGGVALLALAACGLVLCAHDRAPESTRAADPPLCAYNTDESNCETFHESDDGSECNIRRTESFRRAMAKYPSAKNFDVRRTSSFHSARYLHDAHDPPKCSEIRHSASCRVHSLQNISRKREMDALSDHLVMHLPAETSYNTIPKPMNTFYTMPRKMRHRAAREISDEASEITSDGFSLPPPPDEFTSYRAASRIKDIPAKTPPTYTTVRRNIPSKDPSKYSNVIISPMNTVGLPSVSGHQSSLYTYPDDDQVNTNPFEDSS